MWVLLCFRSEDQLDNTGVHNNNNVHAPRVPPDAADKYPQSSMPSYHSNSSMNGPTSLYARNDASPNPSLQSGNGPTHRTVSTHEHHGGGRVRARSHQASTSTVNQCHLTLTLTVKWVLNPINHHSDARLLRLDA